MTLYLESQMRSIWKVISWRVLLTISHVVNGFVVTGSWTTGIQIAGLAAVINSLLFWLHERSWNRLQWNRKPEDVVFTEGNPRTLGKIVSWRVLITMSNFVIPFIMTGSWGSAAMFLGLATIVNMILFYVHERVWNRINNGKVVKDE